MKMDWYTSLKLTSILCCNRLLTERERKLKRLLALGDSKINKSIDTKTLIKHKRLFDTVLKLLLSPRARKLANY